MQLKINSARARVTVLWQHAQNHEVIMFVSTAPSEKINWIRRKKKDIRRKKRQIIYRMCLYTSESYIYIYTNTCTVAKAHIAPLLAQGCLSVYFHHLTANRASLSVLLCMFAYVTYSLPLVCTVYSVCERVCMFVCLHVLASVCLLGMLSPSQLRTLPLSPASQERLT